jgi:hypothetical protein
MIDFKNPQYLKLHEAKDAGFVKIIKEFLCPDENIVGIFKSVRDGVVFTNKRLIVVGVEGITGKKKDMTSLPYSKIQAFAVETAGVVDIDSELQLWYSGLGLVRLEFVSGSAIKNICKVISQYVL